MTVVMMRFRWNFVAGAELDDAIFEFMQIFRRVSRVDDELCRADDFSKVIGAVVRQDDHAIMLGDFLRRCFDRLQRCSVRAVSSARADRCRREARLCP